MDKVSLVGNSLLALVFAGAILYFFGKLMFWRFQRRGETTARWYWTGSKWAIIAYATAAGAVGVIGSIFWVHPGLWGPLVLLFAGVWAVINDIGPGAKLPWAFVPLETGFRVGERLVLLGGAAGTLIAYVVSLP